MTTTALFFLSLLFTSLYVESSAVDFINKSSDNKQLRFFSILLTCIGWTLFYHLNH
jgi:hypothetical protein